MNENIENKVNDILESLDYWERKNYQALHKTLMDEIRMIIKEELEEVANKLYKKICEKIDAESII